MCNLKIHSEVESQYSSELGEVTAAIWALNKTMLIRRVPSIQLCRDSKDFILTHRNINKAKNMRSLRQLDYLMEIPQLKVRFTPGKFNNIADMFSRSHKVNFMQAIVG